MSSTAVVAIFIPVVLRICRMTSIPPGQLMMPISVAALISGMLTLVATAPNLVINAELARHGISGFQFFSFTPFGVPVLALGIIYMIVARRLLGARRGVAPGLQQRQFVRQHRRNYAPTIYYWLTSSRPLPKNRHCWMAIRSTSCLSATIQDILPTHTMKSAWRRPCCRLSLR